MRIRGDVEKLKTLRQWLSQLVLLAFVCRALVPVGYMPDFSKSGNVLKVVICSVHGFQSIDIETPENKAPAKSGALQQEPCAFSSAATLGFLSSPEIDIASSSVAIDATFLGAFNILPPALAGPALGARAPPQIS